MTLEEAIQGDAFLKDSCERRGKSEGLMDETTGRKGVAEKLAALGPALRRC